MDQKAGAGLKVVLLLGGTMLACGGAAFLSIILAVALSSGLGSGATGDRMMIVMGLLGGLFLASLPIVLLLIRRWTDRMGLALALAFVTALGEGLIWVGTFFGMAVVLNR